MIALRRLSFVPFAAVLALTFGSCSDKRKSGVDGIEDAYNDLAGFACDCVKDQGGSNEQVQQCRQEFTAENNLPLACIEDAVGSDPEAKATLDCIADATYDYAGCFSGGGCSGIFDENRIRSCTEALTRDVQQCPALPADVAMRYAACFDDSDECDAADPACGLIPDPRRLLDTLR